MEKRILRQDDFVIVIEDKPATPSGFARYSDYHCMVCSKDASRLVDQVCLRHALNAIGLRWDDYVMDTESRRRPITDVLDPNDEEERNYFCIEYYLSEKK